MKMYEKMGIDPTTEEGMEKIITINCYEIPDEISEQAIVSNGTCPHAHTTCHKCKAERLLKEIPTKKVQRGTTYTDFNKAYDDFLRDGNTCRTYCGWLCEEIEVEDV